MRTWLAITLIAFAPLGALGGEPIRPAGKQPWQRLLTGDDARRAADLGKRIVAAEQTDDLATALRAADDLWSLRKTIQGADHWQAVSTRWSLDAIRKVASLNEE